MATLRQWRNSWTMELMICESVQKWIILTKDENLVKEPFHRSTTEFIDGELRREAFSEEAIAEMMGHPWHSVVKEGAFIYPWGDLHTDLPIRSVAQRPVSVYIAYTPYSECNGTKVTGDPDSDLFHCGHGLCIPKIYVMDGVVNCPFKDCADEKSFSEVNAAFYAFAIGMVLLIFVLPVFVSWNYRRRQCPSEQGNVEECPIDAPQAGVIFTRNSESLGVDHPHLI